MQHQGEGGTLALQRYFTKKFTRYIITVANSEPELKRHNPHTHPLISIS